MRHTLMFNILLLFLAGTPVMAEEIELKQSKRVAPFLMEGLLQVSAGDLDGDGLCELVVLGRDYTEPQALFHILKPGDGELEPVWRSPNILEERSPVYLATGDFLAAGRPEIIVVTNHRAEVYGWEVGMGYHRRLVLTYNINPGEVTAGDWDGDGRDELIITRVAKTGRNYYHEQIVVYRVDNDKLTLLSEGPVVGNIRAICAGDLDGDGRAEVIVEEGLGGKAGKLHVYFNKQTKWALGGDPASLVPAAVYGMTVTRGENSFVYTVSERGFLNIFRWADNSLQPMAQKGISSGLISVAPGGFWADRWGLAVLYYPNGLWLLDGALNHDVMKPNPQPKAADRVDDDKQDQTASDGSMPKAAGENATPSPAEQSAETKMEENGADN